MNGRGSDYTYKPDLPISRHLRSPGHTQADLKNLTTTIIDHTEGYWPKDLLKKDFGLEN